MGCTPGQECLTTAEMAGVMHLDIRYVGQEYYFYFGDPRQLDEP